MQKPDIEQILNILKKELEPVQEKINQDFSIPKHPVALILGSPRSGTTLLLQYLASSGFSGTLFSNSTTGTFCSFFMSNPFSCI